MKVVAGKEFIIWTVCMVIGATVLCVELAVASRRATPKPMVPDASIQNDLIELARFKPAARPDPKRAVTDLFVEAIIQIESGGNPFVVGSHGERGLMQVKSGTWADVTRDLFGERVPFSRAFEPELNRRVGTAYLSQIHAFLQRNKDRWKSDERSLLLACYNAGPQRVAQAGFDVKALPASARDYVHRASALHDAYLAERDMAIDGRQLAVVRSQLTIPGS